MVGQGWVIEGYGGENSSSNAQVGSYKIPAQAGAQAEQAQTVNPAGRAQGIETQSCRERRWRAVKQTRDAENKKDAEYIPSEAKPRWNCVRERAKRAEVPALGRIAERKTVVLSIFYQSKHWATCRDERVVMGTKGCWLEGEKGKIFFVVADFWA